MSVAFAARESLPRITWAATLGVRLERGEVRSAALLVEGRTIYFRAEDSEALVDALLLVRGNVYMHDANRQLRWFFDRCMDRGLHLLPDFAVRHSNRGSRIQSIRTGKLTLRDSWSLWATSLEEFSAGAGEVDAFGPRADCLRIQLGLERLRLAQHALRIDGRRSIGSSAWWTVRRRYHLPDADPSRSRHHWVRDAVHGGRVEVLRVEAKYAYEYDQTMAYTAALQDVRLPVTEGNQFFDFGARTALRYNRAGFYRVEVEQPESFLPVLPLRTPSGRVGYPVGRFITTVPLAELRYAEQRGVRILNVTRCQVYRRSAFLFHDWARWLWRKRAKYADDPSPFWRPIADYLKRLAVALPGVFGLSPYQESLVFAPSREELRPCPCTGQGHSFCPCRGRCCGGCEGDCGALTPFSEERDVWVKRTHKILPRSHAAWFALVLSACRVSLHQFATRAPVGDGNDLVSLSTDGLRSLQLRPTGDPGVGAWRLKRTVESVVNLAPNYSSAVDAETGEVLTRAAGLPRRSSHGHLSDARMARRLTAHDVLRQALPSHERLVPFAEGLRTGRTSQTREESPELGPYQDSAGRLWYGSRILPPGSVVTRAPTVDELLSV